MSRVRTPAKRAAAKAAARPRPRAKRGQGDRLREEILDAATAILLETASAEKVSTRAVANRVGCSSPSIYLHFPDRASLLFAVCQRQFELLGALLRDSVAGIDDPVERLHRLGTAYCRFALDHPQQYRTMMMDVIAGVAWEKDFAEMRSELGFDLVFTAVEQGIAEGRLRAVDPTLAAFGFWCVAHGAVSIIIAKPGMGWPSVDELIEYVLHQAMYGLCDEPTDVPAGHPADRPDA